MIRVGETSSVEFLQIGSKILDSLSIEKLVMSGDVPFDPPFGSRMTVGGNREF